MKKIIVLLSIILLCGLNVKAQNSISFTDSLKIYEGTWKYENTQTKEIFIIKLTQFTDHSQSNVRYGYLGTYSYYKNSSEVVNSHGIKIPLNYLTAYYSIPWEMISKIPIQLFCHDYAEKLDLGFDDLTYKKYEAGGYVQLLSTKAGDEKLLWYPQNGEGVILDIIGEPERPDGFSVPVNVVMTKVH